MKKTLRSFRVLPVLVTLFITFISYGQLPDFVLTAVPTPQTCLGNGSIAFTVTGNNPSASLDYEVYLLPNTTTPVVVVTSPVVNGLVAGNYLIVATQSLGNQSNTATATITIANNIEPLQYQLVPTNVRCGNDGVITVNITSGTGAVYEITAGPVTVAPQASNVFNNLPAGQYQVRVYDDCGEAVVTALLLGESQTNIIVGAGQPLAGQLPSCNEIFVQHAFGAPNGQEIFYPLTLEYTIFPPGGGAPVVETQTVSSGSNGINMITGTLPFYYNQEYSYNLEITDACGNVFVRNNNVINQELSLAFMQTNENCADKFFTLTAGTYVGPVTLNFTSAPAGFDPSDFNASHPTFPETPVDYGGSNNYVPSGVYNVEITDACGRTASLEFEVTEPVVEPILLPEVIGCVDFGSITIEIPGREIVSITMTGAPDGFPETLPVDVSDNITDFGFLIEGIPLGVYTFEFTDSCGDSYTESVELEVTGGNPNLTALQRPGCEEDYGSVRIYSPGSNLSFVTITAAPSAFPESVPADVSENVASNGSFYMNSLPEGNYTFQTTDSCNIERTIEVTVIGYEITVNDIEIIPSCGMFGIDLSHTSNGNYVHSFWLQKYNEVTGAWEHPLTGVPYTEGALPTSANSVYLTNNTINNNNAYTGQFRIVKAFYTYSNGITSNNICTQEIYNFTFDGGPVITDAYNFPCADGLTEVAVIAYGVPPLTYNITTKDGEPFLVENGTSNIFSGLESAIYNFQVADDCGNIRNIQFDITTLEPVAIEAEGFCEGEQSQLFVQPFSFLTYEWYEASNPDVILSTTSELDFSEFNSESDAGTYIVNISADDTESCMNQTLEYIILPNAQPNAGEDAVAALCNDGEDIDLLAYLSPAHDAGGVWQDTDGSGALTGNTLATDGLAEGTYSFTYTVTGLCDNTDEAIVTLEVKNRPAAPQADPVAALCEGEALQLTASNVAGATYQWTGPNNFTSAEQNPLINTASTAATGTYTVTVTLNGCASPGAEVAVTVNAVPAFSIDGTTSICEGQGTELTVNPENFNGTAVDYTWYYEGDEIAGLTEAGIEAFETGEYEVVVNNNGCETRNQVTVTENNAAFIVEAEGGCRDYNYIIAVANADELPGAVFEWTGPSGFAFIGSEADITDLPTGDYTVTVTNAEGCTAQDTLTIDNTSCFIPRGLSPNNDGLNDSFDLSNLDVREIKIFNRYGLEVYEQQNYIDEWYGQSDKGELPAGTYFYVLTLSEGKNVTGWVYLQREVSR